MTTEKRASNAIVVEALIEGLGICHFAMDSTTCSALIGIDFVSSSEIGP